MDILSILPSNPDESKRIWQYSERPATYAKFIQHDPYKINHHDDKTNNRKSFVEVQQCIKQDVLAEKEHAEEPNKTTKQSSKSSKTSKTKPQKLTPDEFIMQRAECVDIEHIRSELIKFISKKEFNKTFGVKKTSEIMKGLTENKWNKSLVLFLSFLFDVKFIYLNKDVSFYPEKESDTLTI